MPVACLKKHVIWLLSGWSREKRDREHVSTTVKGQNEFPVTVFGIAGGKLDCKPRGKAASAYPSQRHVTEGYIIVYTTNFSHCK